MVIKTVFSSPRFFIFPHPKHRHCAPMLFPELYYDPLELFLFVTLAFLPELSANISMTAPACGAVCGLQTPFSSKI